MKVNLHIVLCCALVSACSLSSVALAGKPSFKGPSGLSSSIAQSGKPSYQTGRPAPSNNGQQLKFVPGLVTGKVKPIDSGIGNGQPPAGTFKFVPGLVTTPRKTLPYTPGQPFFEAKPAITFTPGRLIDTGKPKIDFPAGRIIDTSKPKIHDLPGLSEAIAGKQGGSGNGGAGNGNGGKKKMPICQPYCYPQGPFGYCNPCPKWYFGWCWYPGFNNCYGYTGGHCLPTVVQETVVVYMPSPEVIAQGNLPQLVPGTTVAVAALNLGSQPGQVMLEIGSIALPCQVNEWTNDKVVLTVPVMGLKAETPARMVLLRADGQVARTIDLELVAATVAQN